GIDSEPGLAGGRGKGHTPDDLIEKPAPTVAKARAADVRPQVEGQPIDAAAREMRLADQTLRYSKLVLANGAEPIRLPLAGDGADDVFKVNNRTHYAAFRPAIDRAERVAVLGAGLIGCEFSNDLAAHGMRVDCIDPIDWPLQRFLPQACGVAVREGLSAAGVAWHLGRTVTAVQRNPAGGLRVELDDATVLEVDAVLSAVELRPATALAATAGLRINHGVVVDRHLQTSDPHIHALGDCAEVDGLFRPFVAPLMQAARALGRTLAGKPTAVRYPALPIIVKTPACPTIVYPPVKQGGNWRIDGEAPDLEASCVADDGRLTGFALTGAATQQRGRYIKAAPPMLG